MVETIELRRLTELASLAPLRGRPMVRAGFLYLLRKGRLQALADDRQRLLEFRYEGTATEYVLFQYGQDVCEWIMATFAPYRVPDNELLEVLKPYLLSDWDLISQQRLVVDLSDVDDEFQKIVQDIKRNEASPMLSLEAFPGRIDVITAYGTTVALPMATTIPTKKVVEFESMLSQLEIVLESPAGKEKRVYEFASPQKSLVIDILADFDLTISFPGAGEQAPMNNGVIHVGKPSRFTPQFFVKALGPCLLIVLFGLLAGQPLHWEFLATAFSFLLLGLFFAIFA